jgi:hypothetical protein
MEQPVVDLKRSDTAMQLLRDLGLEGRLEQITRLMSEPEWSALENLYRLSNSLRGDDRKKFLEAAWMTTMQMLRERLIGKGHSEGDCTGALELLWLELREADATTEHPSPAP